MCKRVLLSLSVAVIAVIVYYYYGDAYFARRPGDDMFTGDQLSVHDGKQSPTLYLSLLGKVYDVTAGKKHYGPGQTYNIFVGRDASRSFITGEFSDTGANLDEVLDLSFNDLLGLENWSEMYQKQYIYKGKLIGKFYDAYGEETEYMKLVRDKIDLAKKEKADKDILNRKFPPCNAEWDVDKGSKFWCTKKSGGIDRDWAGVPREYYSPDLTSSYCVCVNPESDIFIKGSAQFKEYEGCDKLSSVCHVKDAS